MSWTRMLGGAVAVSAGLLLSVGVASAQVPGQCDFSAQGCTSEQAPPGGNGNVNTPSSPNSPSAPSAPSAGVTAGAPASANAPASGGGSTTPGEVQGVSQTAPAPASGGAVQGGAAQAAPAAAQESPVGGLAFTGADIAGMVALAFGCIGLGTFLMRRSRKPHTA